MSVTNNYQNEITKEDPKFDGRTLTDPGTELTQVRVRVPADSDSCGEFKITCGSTTQLPRPGASCLAYAPRFADTALLRVAICLTRECVETTRAC
ncbi:hypothetical protein RUM43_009521 [Polyplax serrata]|uniref:Uncharacterized protein n=1 Tax=Polyplax serrata TaxID=468196 RepID=A0AAN8PWJ8_POLSC